MNPTNPTNSTNSRTLCVTGGAGFIGSNFIRQTLKKRPNYNIINLDALTYAGNPKNLEDLPQEQKDRYQLIQADIRDLPTLHDIFRKHSIDAVIHFAAESHVDRSIHNPTTFVETNVLGTGNLLVAALQSWTEKNKPDNFRFHHVSTDEVYGSLGPEGYFKETTPYDPSSPLLSLQGRIRPLG